MNADERDEDVAAAWRRVPKLEVEVRPDVAGMILALALLVAIYFVWALAQ